MGPAGSTEKLAEAGSTGAGRGKKLEVGEEGGKFISLTTGLTVVSVSSSSPARQSLPDSDRAKILRYLPDVVLINSAANNGLMLGIDQHPREVKNQLVSLMEEMTGFVFALDDVAEKDPFTYFEGWPIIPRVDQTGLYQLIVNSKSLTKTKEEDLENLARRVKTFNIAKTSTCLTDEAKMVIQVNHVLEFIAYWDCLRKDFSLERRHTWSLKPRDRLDPRSEPAGDRIFWMKATDAGFTALSVAQKQFNLKCQLDNLGKVKHLESDLFGVENSFLVVFCGKEKFSGVISSAGLSMLELPESALPDIYIPNYEVNEKGLFR